MLWVIYFQSHRYQNVHYLILKKAQSFSSVCSKVLLWHLRIATDWEASSDKRPCPSLADLSPSWTSWITQCHGSIAYNLVEVGVDYGQVRALANPMNQWLLLQSSSHFLNCELTGTIARYFSFWSISIILSSASGIIPIIVTAHARWQNRTQSTDHSLDAHTYVFVSLHFFFAESSFSSQSLTSEIMLNTTHSSSLD